MRDSKLGRKLSEEHKAKISASHSKGKMTLSKQKGNAFERKIANLFSSRFEEATGLTAAFRRNVDSGSFFGRTNQKRVETHGTENAQFGDIMTPSTFRFCLECKHYKAPPSLNAIIKQDWKMLDEWIDQAQQDAVNAGKDWMVIVKFNNIDEFVVTEKMIGNAKSVFTYKGWPVFPLSQLLLEADTHFFLDNT